MDLPIGTLLSKACAQRLEDYQASLYGGGSELLSAADVRSYRQRSSRNAEPEYVTASGEFRSWEPLAAPFLSRFQRSQILFSTSLCQDFCNLNLNKNRMRGDRGSLFLTQIDMIAELAAIDRTLKLVCMEIVADF